MSDTTAHLNIPRPNRARFPPLNVDEEFDNLALAWDTVDAFLHALAQSVTQKAPAEHDQAMGTIIGLVDALNEKMPKDRQFKLDDLADVNGAADAPAGYTVVKNATGMWVPSTPLAALGPHGHLISEITGLVAALAARPERSEVAAALDELGDAATKNVGTTANTVAAGDDPRFAQNIAPIGSVLMVYGNGTTPAPGHLLMNGFSVTNTYPDLRAFGLANGWRVDGNGDPICPNMGGKFPRGWLPGQVIDSGRVFGTSQADASQKITGSYLNTTLESTNNAVTTEGAFFLDDTKQKSGAVSYATARTISAVGFDSSRVVRTAAETRPSNETFTFWIKAYGAHTDTSDIDLGELTNDINAVGSRVSAIESTLPAYTATINLTGQVSATFPGLPAWANHMEVYVDVTTPTSNQMQLRLGTGGGLQSTGYVGYASSLASGSASSGASASSGFNVNGTAADRCVFRLSREFGNTWNCAWRGRYNAGGQVLGVGDVTLSGPLDTVQFTSAAGQALTGTVRIKYWR